MKKQVTIAAIACALVYVTAYLAVTANRRTTTYKYIPGVGPSSEGVVAVEFYGESRRADDVLYAVFFPLGMIEEAVTGHWYENIGANLLPDVENPEQEN